VDTEVLAVAEDGVRNRPDPRLHGSPIGTNSATCSPIRRSTSPIAVGSTDGSGRSASTIAANRLTWTAELPRVRGTRGLTRAMTVRSWSAAGRPQATEVPSRQKPCRSGETCSKAASSGSRPLAKSSGTSERKTGV
jgi:hypothetical protein